MSRLALADIANKAIPDHAGDELARKLARMSGKSNPRTEIFEKSQSFGLPW